MAPPPADIEPTMVEPTARMFSPGGPYTMGPGYDDPGVESPWDPTFGRGRQPDDGGAGGA